MSFSWIYQTALAGLACAQIPKIVYSACKKNKYVGTFRQRLGKDLPALKHGEAPLLWLHAVSVGETKAIAKLSRLIKERHPNTSLLISSITETGRQEALRSIPQADYHLYLPLDFTPCIRPLIEHFKPKGVILSETDIWWNFLRLAKKQGAFVSVVNGKLSSRSSERLQYLPSLGKKIYNPIDLCCAQTDEYAERFASLGIPQVHVTGNTKFDLQPAITPLSLHMPPGTALVVAGSTHPGEDELIIRELAPLLTIYPHLKIALTPRHPDRFDTVARLLEKSGFTYARYSQLSGDDWRFLLVDAMGVLYNLYGAADFAIVCGSFTPKVGGHNILEPCFAGAPALYGPYVFSQKEMASLVEHYGAGIPCTALNLARKVQRLLDNPEELRTLKNNCSILSAAIQGATERTYEALHPYIRRHIDGK